MKNEKQIWVIYDEEDAYLCPKGFYSEEEAKKYIVEYVIDDEQQVWFSNYLDYLDDFAWKLNQTPKDYAYTAPLSFVDWFNSNDDCKREVDSRYTISPITVEEVSTYE